MSSGTQEDKPASNRDSSAFNKGSLIQLASGDFKHIEDLQTEDFIKSASVSPDFSLQHSKLMRLGNFSSTGQLFNIAVKCISFYLGKSQCQVKHSVQCNINSSPCLTSLYYLTQISIKGTH